MHSPEVSKALTSAGWHPNRRADLAAIRDTGFSLIESAREVLHEFYGLHIGVSGPGRECATSDIHLDPLLATHILGDLQDLEKSLGVRFYPLGEIHRGHGFLLIDENGQTYLFDDELIPLARTFDDALERLILGLLPDTGKE